MSKKKSEHSISARGQPRESRGPEEDREKYLDNLRSMNGFTAIADWTGRLHFASEAPLKELGYTEDELLRIPFWEAPWFRQSEESQTTVKGTISDALKGKSVECRVETFTKDGTPLPVTFTISPLKGTDGEDIISIVAQTEPLGEGDLEAGEPSSEKPHPSTEKLDSILNVMREGYFETDEADKLTVANPSAAKLLGYESPAEMIGQRTADLWADRARGKFLIELSRKGKVEKHQASFQRRDGTEVPVELDAHALLDATGAMVGSQVLFRDMSTIKELERRLKESRTQAGKPKAKSEGGASREAIASNESENWFTTLTEQTADGVAIVQNNVIKFANDNLGRILGYSVEELYGSMFTHVVWPRSASTDTRERFAAAPEQDMPEPCEIEVTKKDGAPLSLEFSSRAIIYEGRPAQFIIVRDTVVDKKTLDALMESAARWRFVLQNIPDILMTVSQDGGILFTNRELPERDSHGRKTLATSIYDYFPPEHHEQVRQALQRVFREAHVEQFEAAGIRYNHADPWYACRAGPIERQGEVISAVVVCTDISDRREAERLRMSEERLKMLFDYAPDACLLYDPQGILVDGNKAAEEITGWPKEELAGKNIFESGLLPTDVVPWVAEALSRSGREKTVPHEATVVRKDGSTVAVEVRSFPINIHGETLVLGIARDITERKRSEKALQKSEERFRTLTEKAPDGVIILDAGSSVVYYSPAFAKMFSYDEDENLGLSAWDFVHPDDIARVLRLFAELVAEPGAARSSELRAKDKDGSWRWTEATATNHLRSPEVAGIVVNLRDITDRKLAEEKLRQSEERFRALVENVSEGILVIDAEWKVLYESPSNQAVGGYLVSDLVDGNALGTMHPEDVPRAVEALGSLLQNPGQIVSFQCRYRHNDRSWRHVEAVARNLLGTPSVQGIVVNFRDITERKQAEEELRKSEEKLAGIVSSVTDSMIMVDEHSNIVWANEVAKSIMGKDLIGKKCHSVYHKRNSPCRPCWVKPTFADSQVHEHETEVVTEDGSHRLFWSKSSVAARHEDGRPRLVLELSRDITERRQAEEALRESERRYRLIADNVTDVIWTLDLGTLQYTYISPSVLRQRGFTVEEAMKRRTDETMPSASLKVAMDAMMEEWTNASEWQRDHSRSRVLEVQQYCRDGSLLWTEIDITAMRDKDGQVTGILGVTRDIARRKRAEEALRKSEERYRALVETAPEIIFTLSAQDGVITSLNSVFETITGWPQDEWIGKHFTELLHPAEMPIAAERFRQAFQGDTPTHLELRFLSRSRDEFIGEVIGTVLGEDTKVVVGFVRDITQRKESERALARYADELARSNAELQQFAYVASHDLQEPLRKVKSFTELLAERYQGKLDDKADKYIAYVVDGATRMQILIRDLLTYSRVATRGKPFEPTSFEEVLSQALDNLEMAVKETNAEINRDPLPTLNADATQMVQLFQNIIGNAIKFHGEVPPRIHVTAESKGNEWLFTVSDNGIGFEQQYADRIFVIFQRLHTREEYSGTGIGLAVCKRIVERHGGRIWAESTPGKGTTFRFTIPTRAEKGGTQS